MSKKSKKANDISMDTIMIIATIIIVLATLVFITITTQSPWPIFIAIVIGVIILVIITPSVTSPKKPKNKKEPEYLTRFRSINQTSSRHTKIPLMEREPNSVLELWIISIFVTLILFYLQPILGTVSGVITGIAILVRIDNNMKLLRRQIKAQNN